MPIVAVAAVAVAVAVPLNGEASQERKSVSLHPLKESAFGACVLR